VLTNVVDGVLLLHITIHGTSLIAATGHCNSGESKTKSKP